MTPTRLAEIRQAAEKSTPGPWKAGRRDMVSYHGDGTGPFKNVYADDPNGKMHLGEQLPAVVCEAFNAVGVDCRDNADFIAGARTWIPELLAEVERLNQEVTEALGALEKQAAWDLHRRVCPMLEKHREGCSECVRLCSEAWWGRSKYFDAYLEAHPELWRDAAGPQGG